MRWKKGLKKNQNSGTTITRMWNGKTTLENSLKVPWKVKYTPTICPSHFTPRYSPKRSENINPYKDLTVNVHSSFWCGNNPNTHQQMDKQQVASPYYSMMSNNEKEWTTDTAAFNMDEAQNNYAEWMNLDKRVIPFTWNSRKCTLTAISVVQWQQISDGLRIGKW